jgi:hypothetical protein
MHLKAIDPALPGIKGAAVEALDADYGTREEAHTGIRSRIEKLSEMSPELKPQVERAIAELLNVYDRNYDPHMKVTWKNFPDNSGHMYSPGCFRCHDGKHVTDDGKVLSNDCTLCHTLLSHDLAADRKSASIKLMDYPHPEDIGDAYKETPCSDCHGAQK